MNNPPVFHVHNSRIIYYITIKYKLFKGLEEVIQDKNAISHEPFSSVGDMLFSKKMYIPERHKRKIY
jgi:hypothetical protein